MNDQNPTTSSWSEKLRSAATLRLLVAGAALLVAMLIQLTSVSDWSTLTTDPTGFVTGNALALIGVVGGVALVLVGLVRGLHR